MLATPATAEKLTIVMAPSPGDTLIYKMQVQQEMSFQGMAITATEGGKVHIVVQKSHEDTLQLSIRFSDFEGSVKNGNDLMERKPQLQGVALLARMSPRGDVLEVKPQTPVPPNLQEELPRLLEEFFPFFADQAIEPGDSWTHIQKVPNKDSANDELRIDGKTEYTLDELSKKDDRKTAKILGVETAKVNFETPAGTVVGDVKGKSEVLVLVDSGWVLERKSTSEFTGMIGTTKGSRVEYTEIHRLR
ncbi:MAG TPA: hypothetical protein VFD07_09585 [Candidatus Krumholzibacteria bacterium]|nr:hypothetical protein [Candidatus Krumholzibacteria bacterium]